MQARIGALSDDIHVREHGLQDTLCDQVNSRAFGDGIFRIEYDNITSTVKALCAVIHDCIDTEDMFVDFFDELRRRKVIPAGAG